MDDAQPVDTAVREIERPALATYEDLAQRIDHELLSVTLTDDAVRKGCTMAAAYGAGGVVVRPSDVEIAVRTLRGRDLRIISVCGYPMGHSTTGAKLYEARDLIRRGATEIEVMINLGKHVSRQFPYIETELVQLASACRADGAKLRVILETGLLALDLRIIGCRIAKRAEAEFVQTTSGLVPMGDYLADLRMIAAKCAGIAQVKLSRINTLEDSLAAYAAGADRIGSTKTDLILEAWREHVDRNTPPK